MAVDGKHGVGRAAEVLDVYQEMGYDIIVLQETRRSGQSALLLRKASVARVNRRLRRYYLIVLLLPNIFTLACLRLSSI